MIFIWKNWKGQSSPDGKRFVWLAIWLLSSDNSYWACGRASGEIDIMEQVGFDPLNIHFSVHNNTYNGAKGNAKTANFVYQQPLLIFIIIIVDWTPYSIKALLMMKQYFEYIKWRPWIFITAFDKKIFYLLFKPRKLEEHGAA